MAGLVKLRPLDFGITEGPETGFAENVVAGARHAAPLVSGGRFVELEVDKPVSDLLDEVMTVDPFTGGRGIGGGILSPELEASIFSQAGSPIDDDTLSSVLSELDALGLEYPNTVRPESRAAQRSAALSFIAHGRREQAEILKRGSGAGVAGAFVGGVATEFTDPVNVATIPIGAPARAGLAVTVAVEASINAAIEGAQTPGKNRLLSEMGEAEESVVSNMLTGAAFGAALPVGIKGAGVLGRAGVGASKVVFNGSRGVRREVATMAAENPSPAVQEAARVITRDIEDEAQAVTVESPEGRAEYRERTQEAEAAAHEARQPDMPERPYVGEARASEDGSELIDPRTLHVRPEVFQFKSEIVAAGGVTPKLQGVTEWVPHRAGVAVVYEYADGSRAIADGHQRTALARRIMEQDPSQDIKIRAEVFRAEDGYSIDDVRVLAALKNIAEAADGMTARMAGDAAKVLRIRPEAIATLPKGPGIARAQNLSRLSDDAFDLYINRVIDERFAELIGKQVQDEKMHLPIARLIERVKPETTEQASSIISQALEAPTSKETTFDLFGENEIIESLYLEQAKVLERAMRIMREDRSVFKTLTEQAERIEGAGSNRLDKTTNADARQQTEVALSAIKSLAHRAGPISEALRNGAKSYKENGKLKSAAEVVADAVRGEVRRNGISGLTGGGAGRSGQPQRTSRASPDANAGFADPAGEAAQSQVRQTQIVPEPSKVEDGLFDQVPVGRGFDDDGAEIVLTKTRQELAEELDADDNFIADLEVCLK